jgi:hypothetical protein
MDIFIKLLSRLNRAGMNPTIGAIHWVLAVNWQIALGTKIGVDHLASFKHLLIARKLHLSLSTYNRAHLFKDCFLNSVRSVKDAPLPSSP